MKTTNYEQFKLIRTNREIQNGLVARLKQSIQKIGYIEARPILVNDKMEIIDGQNRFVACKELGIPIVYAVHRNGTSDNKIIAELNKNQLIWRLGDFIHHFAEQGVKYHCVVRDFEEKYKLGISNSIVICALTKPHNAIKQGKAIPINPKREEISEFIFHCKNLSFYKKHHFVCAVSMMFRKANDEHISKLKKKYMVITEQPSSMAYLNVFQNIINKNRPDNSKIFF